MRILMERVCIVNFFDPIGLDCSITGRLEELIHLAVKMDWGERQNLVLENTNDLSVRALRKVRTRTARMYSSGSIRLLRIGLFLT